jgi:pyruvate dehydrogenase E1 component alpha subunit
MPVETVFETKIQKVTILDEAGNFDATLGEGLIPDVDVVAMYKHMMTCRHFDEIAFKLQRSGRMGTYPENRGQEVPSLAAAYVLQKDDWMVTCYRENAGLFWRGLPMEKILLHWMGDERGNHIEDVRVTPLAIAIGSQMLHATGLAWSEKYKGTGNIACTFFGDGATSEGDFHEAANFAANLDLPVVFVCQNNGWAISTPTKLECSAPTVAQRGVAYGMDCIQVDGNDLFAVVKVVRDAVANARDNNRPTFIEALTYRLGDHTTADDARRYRDADELKMWEKRDPMIRLRNYLEQRDLWSQEQEEEELAIAEKIVSTVVKNAVEIDAPTASDFFDHMYTELPDQLLKQRQTMRTSSLGQDPSQVVLPIQAEVQNNG